jgi:hypothetical protein
MKMGSLNTDRKKAIFLIIKNKISPCIPLTYNLDKWSFKGGLRAEMTDLEGIVSEPYEINKNNYWSLFRQLMCSIPQKINRNSDSPMEKNQQTFLFMAESCKSYYNLFSYFQEILN